MHFLETLYGGYEEPVYQPNPKIADVISEIFTPKWVADLDVSFRVTPRITISAGANNLFNIYPDRVPAALLAKTANVDNVLVNAINKNEPQYASIYGLPENGGGEYGTVAPFGLEGGFYYLRFGLKF